MIKICNILILFTKTFTAIIKNSTKRIMMKFVGGKKEKSERFEKRS